MHHIDTFSLDTVDSLIGGQHSSGNLPHIFRRLRIAFDIGHLFQNFLSILSEIFPVHFKAQKLGSLIKSGVWIAQTDIDGVALGQLELAVIYFFVYIIDYLGEVGISVLIDRCLLLDSDCIVSMCIGRQLADRAMVETCGLVYRHMSAGKKIQKGYSRFLWIVACRAQG